MRGMRGLFVVAIFSGIISGWAIAQDHAVATPNAALAYDLSREVTMLGTVQTFTPTAPTAPLGARLVLQTGSGVVDVHVGDVRLLTANHFTIQSGDSLRIVGEAVSYGKGTQFVARLLQKGTQVLAVRSRQGLPLSYMAPRDGSNAKSQVGVL